MTIDPSADFHMHSTYSDGRWAIDDMARAALSKGLHTIAITDHVPLPYDMRYAMDRQDLSQYRIEISRVKKKYAGQLTVLTGLEIEYIPAFRNWFGDIAAMGWEICLTSIHALFRGDEFSIINGKETEFCNCLAHLFQGDIKSLCRAYYETMQEAVETGWFDIAAHLDVLKKFNAGHRYFDETETWYQDLIQNTLKAIRSAGMKLEINTSGLLHPIGEPYPSAWIIQEAKKRGIPIVMGSDSHRPDTIGQGFDAVAKRR